MKSSARPASNLSSLTSFGRPRRPTRPSCTYCARASMFVERCANRHHSGCRNQIIKGSIKMNKEFATKISRVLEGKVIIRGYSHEQLIGDRTYAEGIFLTL